MGPSFFDLFKHYKVTPDINTCNLLINIYNDDNNMESAAKLLTEMEQHQMVPNLATFNSFLQGFYDRSDYRSAFSYWEKMKASKIAGDRTTYKLLFRMARDRARFYEIVKQLVVDFGDTEVRSKIVVAAIGVYGKLRDTERISFLFYSLGPNGFPPDAPVYSAMIECYAKLNMKQEALKFYEKMKGRGFFPSVTACNSIISIYGENEDIASIEKITQDMESRGMDVANVTSLLVDAYSRKKELVAQLEEDAEPKETST
uniref:Pentacotripeptide-repeat region of PRORP domain-containing protein n=1 Tax=Arcella intermedia TaxID=1963864 RepID=A0A6B2LDT6_9EUKA